MFTFETRLPTPAAQAVERPVRKIAEKTRQGRNLRMRGSGGGG
jgi:hypothetical protein